MIVLGTGNNPKPLILQDDIVCVCVCVCTHSPHQSTPLPCGVDACTSGYAYVPTRVHALVDRAHVLALERFAFREGVSRTRANVQAQGRRRVR
jgi:hypothetical protein